jgi:hypothetical protein
MPPTFEAGDSRCGAEILKQRVKDEISKHRQIKFSCGTMWIRMLCLKGEKHRRLYNIGTTRLQEDLNLISLIKQVRYMSAILDSSLLKSKSRKFQVMHSRQNVIDLDSDEGYFHKPNLDTLDEIGGPRENTLFYFAKDD